jgi:uncharacterized protein (UPF0335 family)
MDDKTINEIMSILDGWTGNLSWELLIDEITTRLHIRYTRQALNNHVRIKQAFASRKKSLSFEAVKCSKPAHPELEHAQQRIERLEAENQRLRMENNNLLEQFVRWAYNASTRGFDEQFLNQPLVKVHRDPTMPNVVVITDRRAKS